MSGKLLLGIAVAGVGWVALGRSRTASAAAASSTASDTQAAELAAATVGDPANSAAGAAGIAGQVACGTEGPALVGGSPVAGVSNLNASGIAQTMPVNYTGPSGEGSMKVDYTKSTGGPDPSTQSTAVGSQMGVYKMGVATPEAQIGTTGASGFFSTADNSNLIYRAGFGPNGAYGVTQDTRTRAFMEIGKLGGEVW